jgi:Uma2 family endonuclease
VTGEAAGYRVGEDVLSPDGAFTREKPAREGFSPTAPLLAIEVISPSDKSADVMRKLRKYSAAGVLVWVVYPQQRIVDIWQPGQPVQSLTQDADLTAPEILPGFRFAIRTLFTD